MVTKYKLTQLLDLLEQNVRLLQFFLVSLILILYLRLQVNEIKINNNIVVDHEWNKFKFLILVI